MNPSIGLNVFDNVDKLFFTLGLIVTITFIISQFMSKLGKPIVMSGIFAGFIIHKLPLSDAFFDPETCNAVGSLGIVLFMMLIGSQFEYTSFIRHKINIMAGALTLFIPFAIGSLCSMYLIHINFADDGGRDYQILFNIFIGLATSMTAFPLVSMFLANNERINRKIAHLALFCASISEFLFWIILGGVLLYFQHSAVLTHFKPVDIIFYLIFIFGVAPRLINYIASKIKTMRGMLGFVMAGCLLSAALSDLVDLHQIFGGFIFGVLLPRDNPLIKEINSRIGDLVSSLLLPAYFVKTGINANLHFIWNITSLYVVLGITTIAILGKFGSAMITGRIMGYNLRESVLLGSLLNMRGIFEIMLLNIGLEVGLINDKLYSVLIIMTLITTFIATSLSPWFNKFVKY